VGNYDVSSIIIPHTAFISILQINLYSVVRISFVDYMHCTKWGRQGTGPWKTQCCYTSPWIRNGWKSLP